MSRQNFTASNKTYKLDETANSTVCVPSKIICANGIKQVGSVTSVERGTNVTVIVAVSAIGSHVRPVLILPTVLLKNHMLTGAPAASIGVAKSTVWPNERFCFDCLKNFIACEGSCKDDPVDLISYKHQF